MNNATTHSASLGEYAETIRALHLVDQQNQATRTRRAVVVGTLLVALGGAALTGCASAANADPSPTHSHHYGA